MGRRTSGGSNKCVDEKRRQLPIYQHYTLSPGKTKSHHPEAKCVHCLKEFVCGSKQRLIRHVRKCNSISNPEQIIAETLNTLARNSANGQLNNSILEASNLLPSQISHIQHSAAQQIVGQAIHQNSTSVISSAANSSGTINIANSTGNTTSTGHHHVMGTVGIVGGSGGGDTLMVTSSPLDESIPAVKKASRRGRKPGGRNSTGPGIHVTTGVDGKTQFTPTSQLPQGSSHIISPITHNGRQINYVNSVATPLAGASVAGVTIGSHLNATNSGHLTCATTNHHHQQQQHQQQQHHSSPFKLNSELIDKAYLKLVLTRNLPLSLCDTKEFQAWVKTFANDYKPPSSINLIAQNLKQEAQSARQRVSNILVKTSKKTINLELHCLPDQIRGHLWYAMIASVDYKRFMISVRDIFCLMNRNGLEPTVTPDQLLNEFIDDCIKRVGSDRVNSLILTGKSDADMIMTKARQSLYTSHPSIVAYNCWWHFTNLLCSDILEHNEPFMNVLRNSNVLINYINKRPHICGPHMEKFLPFIGGPTSIQNGRNDKRWYSHLVCYLLEYIKCNQESIMKALEEYEPAKFLSDNNNNTNNVEDNSSSTTTTTTTTTGNPHSNANRDQQQNSNLGTQQATRDFYHEDSHLAKVKSIVNSETYWTNLNSALTYLRSFRDIVALAQNMSINQSLNGTRSQSAVIGDQVTLAISPIACNILSLSDYMNWLLRYGRSLIDGYKQSADNYRYQLLGRFLNKFSGAIDEFKLLFAAYLLNPKHRCAYMTQKAKDLAIEEILNIASEFMPEESDGHTIFDQWKLYLVREQPYDMVFDENRSTPLEWWMSLPCAESIRRVAIRILRLKAFSSPKPETLYSQLYFYEDETKSNLTETTFEDVAILRYFYDHEDKIGQPSSHGSTHNYTNLSFNHVNNPLVANGFSDRASVGQLHNDYLQDATNPDKLLQATTTLTSTTDYTNGTYNHSVAMTENGGSTPNAIVGSYTSGNNNSNLDLDNHTGMTGSSCVALESLPGYDQFCLYIDFNDTGIQIVEEPIEKKRRKWTAQEILSKVQPNHHANNNNHDIDRK